MAIVVLTFLICWLPFFVLALVRPLAQEVVIPGDFVDISQQNGNGYVRLCSLDNGIIILVDII